LHRPSLETSTAGTAGTKKGAWFESQDAHAANTYKAFHVDIVSISLNAPGRNKKGTWSENPSAHAINTYSDRSC
jgi:hypothetical protein